MRHRKHKFMALAIPALVVTGAVIVMHRGRVEPAPARAEAPWVVEFEANEGQWTADVWANSIGFVRAELPPGTTATVPEYRGLRDVRSGPDFVGILPLAASDLRAPNPNPRWEVHGFADCRDASGNTNRRRYEIILSRDGGRWSLVSLKWTE